MKLSVAKEPFCVINASLMQTQVSYSKIIIHKAKAAELCLSDFVGLCEVDTDEVLYLEVNVYRIQRKDCDKRSFKERFLLLFVF